ncbi:MAG TPA: rod shape-determining protein MreC [Bacteroidia bacterium]|nr:rod shape-determining protein MreC [Bacteroidia bacterium]
MYGIIAFFRRHYFAVLFVVLEFLSLSFVFRDNYYHQAGFFNSANSVAGSFYKTYNDITSYFNLKSENTQLHEENMRLHNSISTIPDTTKHPKIAHVNPYGQQFNFISAEVIDNSTNQVNNYITLNVGKTQGITEGMGVISPSGIVGVVIGVSDHYAVVMSMLHKNYQLSAMLKKGGAFGTITWKGDDSRFASLSQIPMSEQVIAGDTIISSGYSTVYPKGVTVGVVEKVDPIPTQYFYTIKVRLSTNFKKLGFVYVVSDLMKKEKEELEDNAQKANNVK